MRRLSVLILLFLLCHVCFCHADENPFIVQHSQPLFSTRASIPITTTTVMVPPTSSPVRNLSVSGNVYLPTDTSLVRVVLQDTNDNLWLVYEATQMLVNGTRQSFVNHGEETLSLNGVCPKQLKVYIRNARLNLSGIRADTCQTSVPHAPMNPENRLELRRRQVQMKVDSINAYNIRNGILWRAGVNELALWDMKTKKEKLGLVTDDYETYGYEYYVSGLFEVGSRSASGNHLSSSANSPYVPSFDWRNRHGRNWNTSVKHQGQSGYCTAFATVAAAEALFNMYMNDSVNLDLSEQDAALYSSNRDHSISPGVWKDGMYIAYPANYLVEKGICFEEDMPFINQQVYSPTYRPDGLDLFFADGYRRLYSGTYLTTASDDAFMEKVDSVKSAIIKHGPMVTGIYNHLTDSSKINHALALVGYQDVINGDTISLIKNDGNFQGAVVASLDDQHTKYYVGKTVWICKDSYGTDSGRGHNGYMYVLYNTYDCMHTPIYFRLPLTVTSETKSFSMRIADEDGDGFYTWGFGQPKPESLPEWVPPVQDGDDSDPSKGPLNQYGYALDNTYDPSNTIYIDENTTWSTLRHLYRPVVVRNGAKLTLDCKLTGCPGATITVEDGSFLDVREGAMTDVNVKGQGKVSIIRGTVENNPQIRIERTSGHSIIIDRN